VFTVPIDLLVTLSLALLGLYGIAAALAFTTMLAYEGWCLLHNWWTTR
jgi:hypothetical protein